MRYTLPHFSHYHVLVIGDVMLDRYWYGTMQRISPEAPVPIVQIQQGDERPGGAANTALNVAALGCQTTLLGIVGQDENANLLKGKLQGAGIRHHLSLGPIPTTTKLRVISQHQQLLRLDFEEPTDHLDINPLLDEMKRLLPTLHGLILSDYQKGVLAHAEQFIALARQAKLPVFVDPKGTDFSRYRGATLITPNRKEFEVVVGGCKTEEDFYEKGLKLIEDLELSALLITRSEQGMTLIRPSHPALHLPAHQLEIYDVTGAGDTVIATFASLIAADIDWIQATHLANLAASISVSKLGAATVSVPELQKAMGDTLKFGRGVLNEDQLMMAVAASRLRGERVIMTNGCFDILHAGHVAYLREAKQLGDRLIIAVNDDASVQRLKGQSRPINSLERRMAVLASLSSVDWVIPFSEDTPERLICTVAPDVLVKGGDYHPDDIPGNKCIKARGGRVEVLSFKPGISTTQIVDHIKSIPIANDTTS